MYLQQMAGHWPPLCPCPNSGILDAAFPLSPSRGPFILPCLQGLLDEAQATIMELRAGVALLPALQVSIVCCTYHNGDWDATLPNCPTIQAHKRN